MIARLASFPALWRSNGIRFAPVWQMGLFHVLAVAGVVLLGISWTAVLISVALYAIRMFFIVTGYHRYFSHRSFRLNRFWQLVWALVAMTSTQKGVLWWASHHRRHHRYADTDRDLHSPARRGFWWAHVGWVLSDQFDHTVHEEVRDLAKFPELVWLNRHPLTPPLVYALAVAGLGLAWDGWLGAANFLLWGFVVSTVLLWHGSFSINSFAHIWGRRPQEREDTSGNSLTLALLTLGEGWHNDHHADPASVRQGKHWWRIDLAYLGLRALSLVRVVRLPARRIPATA
ncbi:MAG TPA: fatty acid desaturase [Planctomycetota bacterium]|nr:fatty acid desaturase [Planctomycetota bacterium]